VFYPLYVRILSAYAYQESVSLVLARHVSYGVTTSGIAVTPGKTSPTLVVMCPLGLCDIQPIAAAEVLRTYQDP
jgi:hypothetical protein